MAPIENKRKAEDIPEDEAKRQKQEDDDESGSEDEMLDMDPEELAAMMEGMEGAEEPAMEDFEDIEGMTEEMFEKFCEAKQAFEEHMDKQESEGKISFLLLQTDIKIRPILQSLEDFQTRLPLLKIKPEIGYYADAIAEELQKKKDEIMTGDDEDEEEEEEENEEAIIKEVNTKMVTAHEQVVTEALDKLIAEVDKKDEDMFAKTTALSVLLMDPELHEMCIEHAITEGHTQKFLNKFAELLNKVMAHSDEDLKIEAQDRKNVVTMIHGFRDELKEFEEAKEALKFDISF